MLESKTTTSLSHPIITIIMNTGKKITIELYPATAPNTVNNFISLVQKGFYNGTLFHRVIPGFMIQGGDPQGTGTGGPGYSIKGEFTQNRFENKLKHTKGVLSMARSQNPNSAGSQFFIMVEDSPHLDGSYAAFGKLITGGDVVQEIASVKRDQADRPENKQVMTNVSVTLNGYQPEEPLVIK